MKPFRWLTDDVRAPSLLAREAGLRLRETPRRWWAALPFGWKVALVAALIWLLAPWFVRITMAWWDLAVNHGATVEWLGPKR